MYSKSGETELMTIEPNHFNFGNWLEEGKGAGRANLP